jgi:hypothetical protein
MAKGYKTALPGEYFPKAGNKDSKLPLPVLWERVGVSASRVKMSDL